MSRQTDPLSEGRHAFGTAYYEITHRTKKAASVDRLFVPEGERGKGVVGRMLECICQEADRQYVTLHAAIAPDRVKGEAQESPRYLKVIGRLRDTFDANGFTSDAFDGEVYRNDKTRIPQRPYNCWRPYNSIRFICRCGRKHTFPRSPKSIKGRKAEETYTLEDGTVKETAETTKTVRCPCGMLTGKDRLGFNGR